MVVCKNTVPVSSRMIMSAVKSEFFNPRPVEHFQQVESVKESTDIPRGYLLELLSRSSTLEKTEFTL